MRGRVRDASTRRRGVHSSMRQQGAAPAEAFALRGVAEAQVRQVLRRAHDDARRPALERRKHGAQALRALVEDCPPQLRGLLRPVQRRERRRLARYERALLHALVLHVHLRARTRRSLRARSAQRGAGGGERRRAPL